MTTSQATPLTSADAVLRLARFAKPHMPWDIVNARSGPSAGVRSLDVWFHLSSLDDLALAERRVVEAGLGEDYADALNLLIGGYNSCDVYRHLFATATAAQRAAALEAVLDAHPELEKQQ